MNYTMMFRSTVLASLLGAFVTGFSYSVSAQSAVGGPMKTKQNTVGGAAKQGPGIGGATAPATVVGTTKKPVDGLSKQPTVVGNPTPGSTGSATPTTSTGKAAKSNLPLTPLNKR